MRKRILLFIAMSLAIVQGFAVGFVSEEFSAAVGQIDSHFVTVTFSGNDGTVIMSNGDGQTPLMAGVNQYIGYYSVSIEGANSNMFSAVIGIATSSTCTVKVTYSPTAAGTHNATLKVERLNAELPQTVMLVGKTSDDPFGAHSYVGNPAKLWNGVELSDEIILPNGVKPTGNLGDLDYPRLKAAPLAIIALIKDWAPIIHMDELLESETFNDVTVGTSVTKTYMVWAHNVYLLSDAISNLCDLNSQLPNPLLPIPQIIPIPKGAQISMKIKLRLNGCIIDNTPASYTPVADDIFYNNPKMFSVNPSRLRPFEIDLEEGGDRVPITVTFNPTAAGRYQFRFQAMIEFYVNGTPIFEWFTHIPLLFLGEQKVHTGTAVDRRITASKRNLDFGEILKGTEKSDTITVSGTNLKGDLTLETNNPNFTVTPSSISADAANSVPVTVTFKPTAEGNHDATLTIKGGKAVELPINLTGTCVVPKVTFTPPTSSLNFGPIVNGRTDSESFTLTGTDLTRDLVLYTNNSIFTVSPRTITPEQAADGVRVTVTYSPTNVDTHSAKLYISGGGVENGPITVNLSGTCVTNQSITVTPSTYDFGSVNQGEERTKKFTVTGTNLTDRISITNQIETIGGEYTISPESLPASGGEVTVTFKPIYNGSSGAAFTFSNGGVSAHLAVTGNCVIPPKISTTTTSLDFGTVVKDKQKSMTFQVSGVSLTGDLTLSSNRPYFTVSPTKITAAEAKTNPTVTVTYTPTAGGNHSGTITISGGGAESKTVSLTGKCAAIDVSPSTYDFGSVNQGEERTKKFTVTGTNLTDRISITNQIETIGGEYTISPESLPASGGEVTVTFKPIYNGSSGAACTLSAGVVSAHLAVTGNCVIPPKISPSTTSLNFGTVAKGKQKSMTFKVSGVSLTGDLTLSSNRPYFTVSPTKITAAEAKTNPTVTVTYSPTAGGNHSGTITISGGGAESKTVSLTGKCAAIDVSPLTYDFGTIGLGGQKTKTFTVTGTNLSDRITIATQLETNGGEYTVSPESLPASGGQVTVTFKPIYTGSSGVSFTLSSGVVFAHLAASGNCVKPNITVNPTSLAFTPASSSKTIKVTGSYLTSNLTLTCSNAPFAVTTKTITPSQAAAGVTVTVECNPPINVRYASGTITISGGGASPKTVNLSYLNSGSEPTPMAGLVKPDDENGDIINGGEIEIAMIGSGIAGTNVDEFAMSTKIYAEGQNIIIESPVEQSAVISDIAGRVRSVNLQVGRNEIPVNDSGVFIVRIREKTAKLMLR